MRFFALFVAALFLGIALFGCDVGMNMMKLAMQEKPDDKQEIPEEKPPAETQKPEPSEQSLDPNYKKAMELSGQLANIYQEVWFQHLEDPQSSF